MHDTLSLTAQALTKNHFQVFQAADTSQAAQIILEDIVPALRPRVVSFGDSMTLLKTGVLDAFRADESITFIDTFETGVERERILERRRKALLSDLFLTGTNAVTTDGRLVNLDMVGNRVGGIVYGPHHVIIVVGANKIVDGLEGAMDRIKREVAPKNAKRHQARTPCAKTGKCQDCNSPERICNVWTITEKSWPKGRIKVVLINEECGL